MPTTHGGAHLYLELLELPLLLIASTAVMHGCCCCCCWDSHALTDHIPLTMHGPAIKVSISSPPPMASHCLSFPVGASRLCQQVAEMLCMRAGVGFQEKAVPQHIQML